MGSTCTVTGEPLGWIWRDGSHKKTSKARWLEYQACLWRSRCWRITPDPTTLWPKSIARHRQGVCPQVRVEIKDMLSHHRLSFCLMGLWKDDGRSKSFCMVAC